MENENRQKIIEAGVDINVALERFLNNDELLLRFLKKFSKDRNYDAFKAAMEEKRYDDAFKAAHTLKGLCGNLSITVLYDIVSKEVESLRHKEYEDAEKMCPEIVKEYERVVAILETLA